MPKEKQQPIPNTKAKSASEKEPTSKEQTSKEPKPVQGDKNNRPIQNASRRRVRELSPQEKPVAKEQEQDKKQERIRNEQKRSVEPSRKQQEQERRHAQTREKIERQQEIIKNKRQEQDKSQQRHQPTREAQGIKQDIDIALQRAERLAKGQEKPQEQEAGKDLSRQERIVRMLQESRQQQELQAQQQQKIMRDGITAQKLQDQMSAFEQREQAQAQARALERQQLKQPDMPTPENGMREAYSEIKLESYAGQAVKVEEKGMAQGVGAGAMLGAMAAKNAPDIGEVKDKLEQAALAPGIAKYAEQALGRTGGLDLGAKIQTAMEKAMEKQSHALPQPGKLELPGR